MPKFLVKLKAFLKTISSLLWECILKTINTLNLLICQSVYCIYEIELAVFLLHVSSNAKIFGKIEPPYFFNKSKVWKNHLSRFNGSEGFLMIPNLYLSEKDIHRPKFDIKNRLISTS